MNPSFNIQASGIYTGSAQLFVEAGPREISFVVMNTGNFFQAVVIYSFSDQMSEAQLKEILEGNELLQQRYLKTHIFWAWPESILMPPELVNDESNIEMLDLVYGDEKKSVIKNDFLYQHNLHNVYRVPQVIRDRVEAKFPYAAQSHQYSLLVNRKMKEGDELFVGFHTNHLTMMLCKEGRLQVIQNFEYSSPEDAAYHLLNACRSFEVLPDKVHLHISGLIDERSALYETLYKYFLNIEFDKLPDGYSFTEEIKDHPSHFFSHLFYQVSCV